MILTSNKAFRVLALILVLLVAVFTFSACKNDKQEAKASPNVVDDGKIKQADQVSVTKALYSSTMHILSQKEFVDETVKLFNSLEYVETDKEIIYADSKTDMYVLFYSFKGERQKALIVTRDGLCAFEVGGQVYEITSEFDFDALDKLIKDNTDPEPTVDPETITEIK